MTLMTSEYETPTTNGHVVPAAGPRIPRREAWVDLPDEYPGFKVKLWVNYPRKLLDDLRSGDQERMKSALMAIVLEHNGWCNQDGTPFPPANTPEFWDEIPDELAGVLITLLNTESGKLAASLRLRSAR